MSGRRANVTTREGDVTLSPSHPSPPHPLIPEILGIDPGLNVTGYGVLEPAGGKLPALRGRRGPRPSHGPIAGRLLAIHEGVREVIATLKPTVMALEELYSHYQRPRTAILMGHARGVICLAGAEAGPGAHYSATQVKRILTGSGRAPKSQVQQAIERELVSCASRSRPTWRTPWPSPCHYYLKERPKAKLPT